MSRVRSFAKQVLDLQQTLLDNTEKPVRLVLPDWSNFVANISMRSGGQIKKFTPYEYQKILIELIEKHSLVIVAKARQLGTTQATISHQLHQAELNPAYVASAFMRNNDDAIALGRRLSVLCKGAESELQSADSKWFRFKNGAEIRIYNSSKEGNRSADSVCSLLFDEAAFQKNFASIYSASTASTVLLGDDARIMVVSTPSAKSGTYWDMLNANNGDKDVVQICKDVGEGRLYSNNLPGFYHFIDEAGACKVFIHWRCHPVYSQQDDFVEKMQAKFALSEEDAQREFNLVFSDEAIEVFAGESIINAECKCKIEAGKEQVFIGIFSSNQGVAGICLQQGVVIGWLSDKNPSPNSVLNIANFLINKTNGSPVNTIIIRKANGGEELANRIKEQFQVRTELVKNSEMNDKIADLQLALSKELLQIPEHKRPADPPIAKQLREFRRFGEKFGAVEGKRDEYVWALAFAVSAANKSNNRRLPFGSG
jgi:hypothetical protein